MIARFHVFHFAVLSVGNPRGKDAQLDEVADRRNAAEIESGVARALLDAGWKVGKQVDSSSQRIQTLGSESHPRERLPLLRDESGPQLRRSAKEKPPRRRAALISERPIGKPLQPGPFQFTTCFTVFDLLPRK